MTLQRGDDRVQITITGDDGVGKTCLVIAYTANHFPDVYVPSIMQQYARSIIFNGKEYCALWNDTAEKGQYADVRLFCYPLTDIILICYSVVNRASFENVEKKWLPEASLHCPQTPILLVATKTDLWCSSSQSCVSHEEGVQLAERLNMKFAETSARSKTGLKYCFDKAMELALNHAFYENRKKRPLSLFGWRSRKEDIPIRPVTPSIDLPPSIEIPSSTMVGDRAGLLDDPSEADVIFLLDDGKEMYAHRVLLCSSSDFFCRVFLQTLPRNQQDKSEIPVPAFTWDEINGRSISGLSSIQHASRGERHQIKVSLSPDVTSQTFRHVLEFIYEGLPNVNADTPKPHLKALLRAADVFYLKKLEEIVINIEKDKAHLNPNISSFVTHLSCQRLRETFFNQPSLSDVQFKLDGKRQIVYAHKAILKARCTVMAKMFSGVFVESAPTCAIPILNITIECFMALLEYLYTDHCPIEEGDAVGIMVTAERFAQDRLKNLCELYITKEVDRSVPECIEKTDIDVIGLLHLAQFHNAQQLSDWCLHFISSNYLVFEKRSEFSQLEGNNLKLITEKRWPPVSYLEEIAQWEKKYGEKKGDNLCCLM